MAGFVIHYSSSLVLPSSSSSSAELMECTLNKTVLGEMCEVVEMNDNSKWASDILKITNEHKKQKVRFPSINGYS